MTFRVTPDERAAFDGATEALGLNMSQLVDTACVDQAHRLGVFDGAEPFVRARPKQWKYVPPRRHSEVSATERLTISLTPISLALIQKAAKWVDVPPSAFMVGSVF